MQDRRKAGGGRMKDERVPFRVFLSRVYLPNLLMNWVVGVPYPEP